jgi:pimeloyl-ACP methyl ester carboxylesterase
MALDLGPADALVARHPLRGQPTVRGRLSYRESGAGPALVLLHGIGSQSGSWVRQLEALAPRFRVIAWDAPGYGDSEPLATEWPSATEYAGSARALLDALRVERAVLIASSLGALVAAALAAESPERVAGLLLLNPAGGYGQSGAKEREEKLATRLARLAELGPAGMAAALPPGMLAQTASDEARALAAWSTARIRRAGYTQAARMLAHGCLVEDAARYFGPVLVVAATEDSITPAAGCERIAQAFPRGAYRLLTGAGHLSYLDAPAAVNAIIAEFAERCAQEAAV